MSTNFTTRAAAESLAVKGCREQPQLAGPRDGSRCSRRTNLRAPVQNRQALFEAAAQTGKRHCRLSKDICLSHWFHERTALEILQSDGRAPCKPSVPRFHIRHTALRQTTCVVGAPGSSRNGRLPRRKCFGSRRSTSSTAEARSQWSESLQPRQRQAKRCSGHRLGTCDSAFRHPPGALRGDRFKGEVVLLTKVHVSCVYNSTSSGGPAAPTALRFAASTHRRLSHYATA